MESKAQNKVKINTCTKEELRTIRGVGGKYAQTIWSWRRAGKQISEDMVRERLREGLVECFDYEEGSAIFYHCSFFYK